MHKKKAGKLQTGITISKQYWLAVNGKPKSGSNPRIPLIYHMLRDKKFKTQILTIHPDNITMILHMKKDLFSVQTISYVYQEYFCPSRLKTIT